MAKPLFWDMINPITGRVFTMDDANLYFDENGHGMYLEPGDPGFVPYPEQLPAPPPEPPRKPFRRTPKTRNQTPTTSTSTHMSTFQYNVAPNPNGGFTTRPVMGEILTEEALLAQVTAATSLTGEQARAVIVAFLDALLAAGATNGFSKGLFGKVSFRSTSGGSKPAANGFNNPDEINAGVALSFTAEAISNWRTTLPIQSMGEVGKVSPIIDSITSQENGQQDHYVAATMIELSGSKLRFDKADPQQGVFIRSGNNPEVRCTVYGPITPTSVSVLIPAGTTGPQTVRIAAFINGSIRSFTYMDPITP